MVGVFPLILNAFGIGLWPSLSKENVVAISYAFKFVNILKFKVLQSIEIQKV